MISLPSFSDLSLIHTGAHTWIYRAKQVSSGESVILKILNPDSLSAVRLARFKQEYALPHNIRHPHIMSPQQLLNTGGYWVIVLEDAQMQSLDRVLQQYPDGLDSETAMTMALQLTEALGALHEAHLVHKDINPGNLLWQPATRQLKLIDFGIASEFDSSATVTEHGGVEGTLHYLAPEQTGLMNLTVDYRCDFYSLGATLFHLLTGQTLYRDPSPLALIHHHVAENADLEHPALLAHPPGLKAILQKLLQKDPALRYQSDDVLRMDLEHCCNGLGANACVAPQLADEQSMRLIVPDYLYGREKETLQLRQALDRVAMGAREVILVSGEPGIGKTSLIRQLFEMPGSCTPFFAQAKCDQYLKHTPFELWIQVGNALADQLLSLPPELLDCYTSGLVERLGSSAAVLASLVPKLSSLLGNPPSLGELPSTEVKNRITQALSILLQTLTSAHTPLVLILDDLQWADQSSLALLEQVTLSPDHHHLLALAIYRDTEVRPGHPLSYFLQTLTTQTTPPVQLHLGTLSTAQMITLLADTLHMPATRLESLAAVCKAKTNGNPFFLIQFLSLLSVKGVLRFSHDRNEWQWDTDAIEGLDLTENVVHLLAGQVAGFPDETLDLLKLAACLSHRFSLYDLALLSNQHEDRVRQRLVPALRSSFIRKEHLTTVGGLATTYQFSHDQLQQACYELLSDEERVGLHLHIGRTLLGKTPEDQLEPCIFLIVDHYNVGAPSLTDPQERLQLARLNLLAGRRARLSGAYSEAAQCLGLGRSLLGTAAWQSEFRIMFDLSTALAETAYLSGDFSRAQELFDEILGHASDLPDIVYCLTLKMQGLQQQGNNLAAIEVQKHALAMLKIDIPEDEAALDALLQESIANAESAAARGEIERLLSREEMQDETARLSIPLLFGLWFASYVAGKPVLCTLAAIKMIEQSLRFGVTDNTPMALANFAFVEVLLRNNLSLARNVGELAVALADQRASVSAKANTHAMYTGLICHWYQPFDEVMRHYELAYQFGIESGDLVIAGNVIPMRAADQFTRGDYLPELLETTEHLMARHRVTGQFDMADLTLASVIQPVRCLMGKTPQPEVYDDEHFSEAAFEAQYQSSPLVMAYYLHSKIRHAFLFDLDNARSLADQVTLVEQMILGQAKAPDALFYAALIWLREGGGSLDDAQQALQTNRVQDALTRYQQWARNCPANFLAKSQLLEAEWAAWQGDIPRAMTLYADALKTAGRMGQVHLVGVISECYACFCRRNDQPRLEAALIQDAIHAYTQWGAKAKVEQLERRNPQPVRSSAKEGATLTRHQATRTQSHFSLDFHAIIEASQALSREVGLQNVLKRLLTVMRQLAGAQIVRLLLPQDPHWFLEAEFDGDQDHVLQHQRIELDQAGHDALPLSLLRVVVQSGQAVIEHDAAHSLQYRNDEYIRKRQPRSLLCIPLTRANRLEGILYLENNLSGNLFSHERLQFLDAIGSQLIISIDNARLHDSLENLVEVRTQALKEANRSLHKQTLMDGLTGIGNRRCFDEVVASEWARAQLSQLPLSLCLIDVDFFKRYNDHYGHIAGDECLRKVASALNSATKRSSDSVARYGGEEFVLVLPDTRASAAKAIAERLRLSILGLCIPHSQNDAAPWVSISVGIASSEHVGVNDLEALIRHADSALYKAKQNGRNQVMENQAS